MYINYSMQVSLNLLDTSDSFICKFIYLFLGIYYGFGIVIWVGQTNLFWFQTSQVQRWENHMICHFMVVFVKTVLLIRVMFQINSVVNGGNYCNLGNFQGQKIFVGTLNPHNKMSLFKYFEKRAKDDLPNPNGPLSSHVPSDESVGQPRVSGGSQSISLVHVGSIRRKETWSIR